MTQYVYIHTAALSYFNSLENLKTNFFVSICCLPVVKNVSCLQHSAIQNIRISILKQTVDPRNRTKNITENIVHRKAVFLFFFFLILLFFVPIIVSTNLLSFGINK